MKNFFKSKFRIAVTVGVLLMIAPALLMLLSAVPAMLYPDDCGIGFQCKHAIVQYAGSLSLSVLVLGLPVMLLGGSILVLSILVYGIHAMRNRDGNHMYIKITLGALAAGVLLFALWIPAGPDECSRTITNRQYNACLEEHLSGKDETEARAWLQARGYKLSELYSKDNWGSLAHEKFGGQHSIASHFDAYRSYGRPHTLPYGTNFARYVVPSFPAPAMYRIAVGVYTDPANTYDIYTDWSFSFL